MKNGHHQYVIFFGPRSHKIPTRSIFNSLYELLLRLLKSYIFLSYRVETNYQTVFDRLILFQIFSLLRFVISWSFREAYAYTTSHLNVYSYPMGTLFLKFFMTIIIIIIEEKSDTKQFIRQ